MGCRLGLLRQEVRRRHVLVDALHLHLADHPVGAEDFQELAGLEAVLLPEADDDEVEFPVNHQDGPGGGGRCGRALQGGNLLDRRRRLGDGRSGRGRRGAGRRGDHDGLRRCPGRHHFFDAALERFLRLPQLGQIVLHFLRVLLGLGQFIRQRQLLAALGVQAARRIIQLRLSAGQLYFGVFDRLPLRGDLIGQFLGLVHQRGDLAVERLHLGLQIGLRLGQLLFLLLQRRLDLQDLFQLGLRPHPLALFRRAPHVEGHGRERGDHADEDKTNRETFILAGHRDLGCRMFDCWHEGEYSTRPRRLAIPA